MQNFDLVFKNGYLYDGTGTPSLRRDLAIGNGKIKSIGKLKDGERIVDVSGLAISPGFIDFHSHADHTILAYPDAKSHVMQGVTTSIVGNCGLTLAPVNPEKLELLKDYISPFLAKDYSYGWDWSSLEEFYDKVRERGTAMNLAPLVGHGSIRLAVKGFDPGDITDRELSEMKRLLDLSMKEGCWGMSSGLIYPPGIHSTTRELVELAKVLREYGGIFAIHLRNEGDKLLDALKEAFEVAERGNVPLEISHHKATGERNWGSVETTLRMMEDARKRGIEVNCDVYPYTAGSTTITSLLPSWSLEDGIKDLLEKEDRRQKLMKDIKERKEGENWLSRLDWNKILIASCKNSKEYEGMTLQEIVEEKNRTNEPYEGFLDWLKEVNADATMCIFMIDKEDMEKVLSNRLSMISSDGWAVEPSSSGKVHPRCYGTFPKILGEYVREKNLLSLKEAIMKMTSMPAGKLGLSDRGLLKEGFWADIVVFDPEEIKDKSTYDDPNLYPTGIEYVVINGKIVVEDGEFVGDRVGEILLKNGKAD